MEITSESLKKKIWSIWQLGRASGGDAILYYVPKSERSGTIINTRTEKWY
jgi:hypothetical protein